MKLLRFVEETSEIEYDGRKLSNIKSVSVVEPFFAAGNVKGLAELCENSKKGTVATRSNR